MKVAELGIEGRACDGESEGVQATVCIKAKLCLIHSKVIADPKFLILRVWDPKKSE